MFADPVQVPWQQYSPATLHSCWFQAAHHGGMWSSYQCDLSSEKASAYDATVSFLSNCLLLCSSLHRRTFDELIGFLGPGIVLDIIGASVYALVTQLALFSEPGIPEETEKHMEKAFLQTALIHSALCLWKGADPAHHKMLCAEQRAQKNWWHMQPPSKCGNTECLHPSVKLNQKHNSTGELLRAKCGTCMGHTEWLNMPSSFHRIAGDRLWKPFAYAQGFQEWRWKNDKTA
jgi:hypothetical protein